jgi:3-dehydro-glucose-6-phosphate--glutamate transaminase
MLNINREPFVVSAESLNLFDLHQAIKKNHKFNLKDGTNKYHQKLIENITDYEGRTNTFNKILKEVIATHDSPVKISFLPLDRLNEGFGSEDFELIIKDVIKSGEFTSGPYIGLLENALKRIFGFKNVILCSSGTDALIIALKSVGVSAGDEVIVPPNSFAATENAIFALGAFPVLADVDKKTYNICPKSVEEKITPKTKCILPVHLYGNLAPIKELNALAQPYGIKIVEDACQAIGLTGVGLYSDAAVLSFNPFKNLGGFGKAGAIVTKNDQVSENCHSFGYHGFIKDNKNVKCLPYGLNSRIDNFQAAIIQCKLHYISLQNFKRICLAERYISSLEKLKIEGKICLPIFQPYNAWHLFPIQNLTNISREYIMEKLLKDYKIETGIYYPILTQHQKTPLQAQFFKNVKLSNIEEIHPKVFHLPFHHNLTLNEQDRVIAALFEIFY